MKPGVYERSWKSVTFGDKYKNYQEAQEMMCFDPNTSDLEKASVYIQVTSRYIDIANTALSHLKLRKLSFRDLLRWLRFGARCAVRIPLYIFKAKKFAGGYQNMTPEQFDICQAGLIKLHFTWGLEKHIEEAFYKATVPHTKGFLALALAKMKMKRNLNRAAKLIEIAFSMAEYAHNEGQLNQAGRLFEKCGSLACALDLNYICIFALKKAERIFELTGAKNQELKMEAG